MSELGQALERGRILAPSDPLGRVHSISGSRAVVGIVIDALSGPHPASITVGKFVKIHTSKALLVGVITDVAVQTSPALQEQGCAAVAHVDLMGEIDESNAGTARFRRGVSDYPTIGDIVIPLTNQELRIVF